MSLRRFVTRASALLVVACTVSRRPAERANEQRSETAEIAQEARSFLGAFDSLNWPAFAAHLSDSVDAYWPRPDTAERLRNRAAVEAQYKAFFERIRAARPGPPYLHLKVTDFDVRVFENVGLVTFELADVPDTLGRRTLVFHREPAGWRIVHLHASNLPLPH